jgi:hypothetical protein
MGMNTRLSVGFGSERKHFYILDRMVNRAKESGVVSAELIQGSTTDALCFVLSSVATSTTTERPGAEQTRTEQKGFAVGDNNIRISTLLVFLPVP